MHETGIVRDLVRHLEAVARDAGADSISGVQVWLGALSQFSPKHFREHFDDEACGSIAERAVLDIITSDDPGDPDALNVMICSVDLEVPETED
ncbi:MAG: hydrogenase/urease maturation nickel metallochaperone HypA [Novosphingobium sp.]